jgi:acyl-CoA reductase-like NAD-dependent aldehyde dehydrogenase
VVLKPSENSPFTAVQFAKLTLGLAGAEALPAGAFNVRALNTHSCTHTHSHTRTHTHTHTTPYSPSPTPTYRLVLTIARACRRGVVPSLVRQVVVGAGEAGAALSAHPGVSKVAFTGSVATGSAVMRAAAAGVTNVTLELGGKSAMIIFDDLSPEELARAAEWAMFSIFWTNGQICSATSRLLIHERIADKVGWGWT